ncbi:hypothetical protein [Burkholderia ubonensis]|uniref:hypothetical protein n=1 Tax=Burkholderia ubonensis TaxID=101571 RepID=UPI000B204DED|nr:hypothetical protein [Burkholderia ubonensis]
MNDKNRLVDEEINQQASSDAAQAVNWPSLAAFNGKLYVVYQGTTNENICYTSFDGKNWEPEKTIFPGFDRITQAVSLSVYNDKLYMAHKGNDTNNKIYYASFDGTQWTRDEEVLSAATLDPVSLMVFDGRLLMFSKDVNNTHINAYNFDGSKWASAGYIGIAATGQSVASTLFNGQPYVAHKAVDSNRIVYTKYTALGNSWTPEKTTDDNAPTSQPVALAVFNDKLYLAHKGVNDGMIYYTSFDGIKWTKEQPVIPATARTPGPVSLTTFGGKLYLAHKGESNNNIYYTSFDGTNWAPEQTVPNVVMAGK